MADGPADDLFGMYHDLFERARELCRLSIDVLNCLEWFREYVSEGIESGGKMYGFNDSPQDLREAIYQLWMRCGERNVPAMRDVFALLPIVQQANAGHLRTIKCGDSFVTTATETIFHWSEWLEGQSLRACLWMPSGSNLDSSAHDPKWAGTIQDVADLEPYHDVLRSIRKANSQWKITENNLRRLECWIEAEHVRTIRYLDELDAVTFAEPQKQAGERPEPPATGTQQTNGDSSGYSPPLDKRGFIELRKRNAILENSDSEITRAKREFHAIEEPGSNWRRFRIPLTELRTRMWDYPSEWNPPTS